MYLRESRQKLANGTLTHLQLVESVWNPAKRRSEIRIVFNCGRAGDPAVTELKSEARERVHVGGTHATANAPVVAPDATVSGVTQPASRAARKHARKRHKPDKDPFSLTNAVGGQW